MALLGSWIPFVGWFVALLGLVAIVLGVIGMVQASKGRAGGTGLAIIGAVLGGVAVVVSILVAVFVVMAINSASTDISDSRESRESRESLESLESLDVQFGTFEVAGDPEFPDTNLPVTLTDKGDVAAGFQVSLSAVAAGTEVDSDVIFSDQSSRVRA